MSDRCCSVRSITDGFDSWLHELTKGAQRSFDVADPVPSKPEQPRKGACMADYRTLKFAAIGLAKPQVLDDPEVQLKVCELALRAQAEAKRLA